jgi:hypothetical protein
MNTRAACFLLCVALANADLVSIILKTNTMQVSLHRARV